MWERKDERCKSEMRDARRPNHEDLLGTCNVKPGRRNSPAAVLAFHTGRWEVAATTPAEVAAVAGEAAAVGVVAIVQAEAVDVVAAAEEAVAAAAVAWADLESLAACWDSTGPIAEVIDTCCSCAHGLDLC